MKRRSTEYELAYVAGLFDAEGEFSKQSSGIGRRRRYVIAFKKCHRASAMLFKQLFGGHITRRPPEKRGYKVVWHWRANGKSAVDAFRTLQPHLRVKRRRLP